MDNETPPIHPGPRVKARRKELHLVQEDIAAAAGVKKSTISRLENGGSLSKLDTLAKIAERLGVTVGWLFGEADASSAAPSKIPVSSVWTPRGVESQEGQRVFEAGTYRRGNFPAWDLVSVAGAGPGWHGLVATRRVRELVGDGDQGVAVEIDEGDLLVMAPPTEVPPRHGALVHAVLEVDTADGLGSKSDLYGYTEVGGVKILLPLAEGQQPEILRPPWEIIAVAVELRRKLTGD